VGHFLDTIFNAVLAQPNGLLLGVFFFFGIYQSWQLERERREREREREIMRKEAEDRVEAYQQLAMANQAIAVALAEVRGLLMRNPS
jgi:hypothetical protein